MHECFTTVHLLINLSDSLHREKMGIVPAKIYVNMSMLKCICVYMILFVTRLPTFVYRIVAMKS